MRKHARILNRRSASRLMSRLFRRGVMPLIGLTPMLTVTSSELAIEFYREVPVSQLTSSFPGWASMGLDGVEVMFALPNEHVSFTRPRVTGSLYLKTDQFTPFGKALKIAAISNTRSKTFNLACASRHPGQLRIPVAIRAGTGSNRPIGKIRPACINSPYNHGAIPITLNE